MTRAPVTRDPQHPDFPHGTPRGRQRGCGCEPCRVARRKQLKRYALLRGKHGSIRWASPEALTQAREHICELLKEPGVSLRSIASVAGTYDSTIGEIRAGARATSPMMTARILRVTPQQALAAAAWTPAKGSIRRIRCLQAQGFPISWQQTRTGHSGLAQIIHRGQTYVKTDIAQTIERLAAEIGDREANLDMDGISPRSSRHARSIAVRAGYYPAKFYDDDGRLDPRSIPGHPWSQVDDRCAHRLDMLAAVVTADAAGESLASLARRLRLQPEMSTVSVRELERLRKSAGIRINDPDRQANLARARDVLSAWQDGDEDVVAAALDLGLYEPTVISRKHPGRIEWERRRTAAATREAEAA